MRILIVVLLMLGHAYAGNVEFLLDTKLSPAEKLIRLKETVSLKKSKDPYYQLSRSTHGLFKFKLSYLNSYVRKGKLIWLKAQLSQAREQKLNIKDFFIKKYGRKFEYIKYDDFLRDDDYTTIYHRYTWKTSKKQAITLTEFGRKLTKSDRKISFEYELEINNFPKKNTHRGPSQKSKNTVLLRVPVTGYYKTTPFMRAFSYNKKMNSSLIDHMNFKSEIEKLWKWQEKTLGVKGKGMGSLYSYYTRKPEKLGKIAELLSKSRGFDKFKILLWEKLNKQQVLVMDCLALVKEVKGEKKSRPRKLSRDLIERVYQKDTKDFTFKSYVYEALIVGMNRKKETVTLSLFDGELVKLSLKSLYARSRHVFNL